MPVMPYAMEKGPYFSVVEDFVNGSQARAAQALGDLRNGVALTEMGPLDVALAGSPYDAASLKYHVNHDWFGFEPVSDATGAVTGWQAQPDFDPVLQPTTGFWQHWYGTPERVFRQTLQRSLEVALGVEHHAGAGGGRVQPTRHWPISMFWNCPHPWYEGWVSWKRHGRGTREGHVTMLVNTPAHGPLSGAGEGHHNGELFNSPLRPAGAKPAAIKPYEVDPKTANAENGMWLVSQVYHQEYTPVSSAGSPPGQWRPPTLGRPIHSLGEVITVAIAEIDGGVLPDGRDYVAGP